MHAMTQILSELPLDPAALVRLGALPGVTVQPHPHKDGRWDLAEEWLPWPEILLCHFPPGNLDRMTGLKFLQLGSVGYEHLRDFHLEDRPLRVCNARGIFDTAIAEWNLAMMVNLTRDLRGMIRNQEKGNWERADRFQQELRGRTVGLWGYGGIGRETARLARAFGMTVHVLTRSGGKPRENTYVQPGTGDAQGILPERVYVAGQERAFLSGLDFLILALPRTRQSTGMVGAAELQALPRTAFVLNPARGPIIQEQALVQALEKGWIAGAALDTHYAYPLPADHPLWRFANVILTPHISGADKSKNFPARIADLCVQNVTRYVEGRPLLNELTRAEWLEVG
jgi:phosphoglycerate dehydrogenase-like enzyme